MDDHMRLGGQPVTPLLPIMTVDHINELNGAQYQTAQDRNLFTFCMTDPGDPAARYFATVRLSTVSYDADEDSYQFTGRFLRGHGTVPSSVARIGRLTDQRMFHGAVGARPQTFQSDDAPDRICWLGRVRMVPS